MTTSTSTPTRTGLRQLVVATPVVLVALWLVWATGLISIKFGLQRADPMAFAVLRVATTTVLLGAALVLRRSSADTAAARSQVHRWALRVGLTQMVAFFTLQSLGMADAGAGLSAILLYTQPFMVAIAARAVLGERLSPRQLVGMVLGWCGVAVLVGGEAAAGTTPVGAMVLLLLAAVAWAASTILFKHVPTEVPLVPLLFWMNVYAVGPLLLFALGSQSTVVWGPHLVLATVWTAAFAGIGGMGLSFVLLRRGEASVVSSWIFAVPIVTALLGVPVLGETLDPRMFLAGGLVALGIALVNWNRQQRPAPSP